MSGKSNWHFYTCFCGKEKLQIIKEHRKEREREQGETLKKMELSHAITEAEKPKICWVGQQVENTGKGQVSVQAQIPTAVEFGEKQCCR